MIMSFIIAMPYQASAVDITALGLTVVFALGSLLLLAIVILAPDPLSICFAGDRRKQKPSLPVLWLRPESSSIDAQLACCRAASKGCAFRFQAVHGAL